MLQNGVYLLCFATSLLCSVLLWRGFLRTRARLLLWSGMCFLFLSINNLLLVVDLLVYPERDIAFAGISFAVLRTLAALTGFAILVFGLIWESQ